MPRNTIERLRQLKSAADQYGERDFSARVAVEAEDELGEVEASFNRMAQRLEKRGERFREIDRLKSDFVSSRVARTTHAFDNHQGSDQTLDARRNNGRKKARISRNDFRRMRPAN